MKIAAALAEVGYQKRRYLYQKCRRLYSADPGCDDEIAGIVAASTNKLLVQGQAFRSDILSMNSV